VLIDVEVVGLFLGFWYKYTPQRLVHCSRNSWKVLVMPHESTIGLGNFNAHVVNDDWIWKGVIGEHGDDNVNDEERLLLQLCCNNAPYIMNTFVQHRDMYKYTWRRDCLVQQSLIGFLHSISWIIPISVGRSCEKGCRTLYRS